MTRAARIRSLTVAADTTWQPSPPEIDAIVAAFQTLEAAPVRTGARFEDSFDDFQGGFGFGGEGRGESTWGACAQIAAFVLDASKNHPMRAPVQSFYTALQGASRKLQPLMAGMDRGHRTGMKNAAQAILSSANSISKSLLTLRQEKSPDEKSEGFAACIFLFQQAIRTVAAQAESRSSLPTDLEQAAAEGMAEYRGLRETADAMWQQAGPCLRCKYLSQLSGALRRGLENIHTYPQVVNRKQLVNVLPVLGVHALLSPLLQTLLPDQRE